MATLVAKEAPPAELFAKVAEEVAPCSATSTASLFRDEGDGTATVVAAGAQAWRPASRSARGCRSTATASSRGPSRRRPYRIDDYSAVSRAIAERARRPRGPLGGRLSDRRRRAHLGRDRRRAYEARPLPPETETRWPSSPTSSPRRSPTPRRARRSSGSPTSRRRCGGSRRWSPKGAPPTAVFDAVAAEMEGLLAPTGSR